MHNQLEFTLFGSPEVHLHGQLIGGFRSSKAQALLFYLAVTGRPYARSTLAGLLWGDQPEAAARASLSKCLSNLHDLVGDALLIERQNVAFDRTYPYTLDSERFAAVTSLSPTPETIATFQAALTLYRGDFLEGFYVRDAPDFEQWLLVERANYREAAIDGLYLLAKCLEQQGNLSGAIQHTRRLLALEPWRESAHRQLMILLARSGQRAAALTQFESCRQLLMNELAVEPDAETLATLEAIRLGAYDQPATKSAGARLEANAPALPTPVPTNPSPLPRRQLPRAGTSFVGREQETAQVVKRLTTPAVRLVTIVGLGGMGKSRLALTAAQQLLDRAAFAAGVCYVPLAGVTSAGLLPSAIAAALEIPVQGALDLEASLIHYLSDKRLLLLLDNLEQLPDAAPILVRILAGAPDIKILATSRARLHLDAEWLLPLDGLTIPPVSDPVRQTETGDPETRYTAVALFAERAGHLRPDFALNAATLPEVNRLCRLVGGMPLAIEMATAWLRALPLAEIAAEIGANLDFLAASPQNDAARHRSMRAVFDHSWHLLAENERQALMRISLFRGGFTRQAAAEVAGAPLHTLAGLIDRSWIQLNPQGRYQIHELARQYAEEKLEADATSASAPRAAHCTYYAILSERLEGRWGHVTHHGHNLQTLLLEIDNMWAGWRWATVNRNFDALGKYIVALGWLADARGLYTEVVEEFEAFNTMTHTLLSDGTLAEAERRQIALEAAKLLSELCYLLARAISVERALALGMDGVEWLRRLRLDGSEGEVATPYLDLLVTMGFVALSYAYYPQARRYCQELMQLSAGRVELLEYHREALHKLGCTAHNEGLFAEAARHLTECLRLAPPDHSIRIWVTDRLTAIYIDLGDLTQAAHFAGVAAALAEQSGGLTDAASVLFSAIELAQAQARFDDAERYLGRVERIATESGNRYMRVRYAISQARAARLMGRPLDAQPLFQEAYTVATSMARRKEAACAQAGVGFALLDQGNYEEARGWLLAALRPAWQGKIMPEAIWAVIGLATLQGIAGQRQRAEAWLRLAQSHPCSPARHIAEVEEMRRRLDLPEISEAPVQAASIEELDAALEAVVLELLG